MTKSFRSLEKQSKYDIQEIGILPDFKTIESFPVVFTVRLYYITFLTSNIERCQQNILTTANQSHRKTKQNDFSVM